MYPQHQNAIAPGKETAAVNAVWRDGLGSTRACTDLDSHKATLGKDEIQRVYEAIASGNHDQLAIYASKFLPEIHAQLKDDGILEPCDDGMEYQVMLGSLNPNPDPTSNSNALS